MGINKAISSGASIGKAVKYVEKNSEIIEGIRCDPETALDEMKFTRQVWDKDGGRKFYHHCHSFAPNENITPEQAQEITKEIYERWKPADGHQMIIGTHTDKGHIHCHIIINSVNPDTGMKYHQNSEELRELKSITNEICKERGFGVPEKSEKTIINSRNKYEALKKEDCYIRDCKDAVKHARETAITKSEFIVKMKEQGYDTKWTDKGKHITFTDEQGRKVRAANLEKTFKEPNGKEDFERDFQRNYEALKAEQMKIKQERTPEAKFEPLEPPIDPEPLKQTIQPMSQAAIKSYVEDRKTLYDMRTEEHGKASKEIADTINACGGEKAPTEIKGVAISALQSNIERKKNLSEMPPLLEKFEKATTATEQQYYKDKIQSVLAKDKELTKTVNQEKAKLQEGFKNLNEPKQEKNNFNLEDALNADVKAKQSMPIRWERTTYDVPEL